MNTAYRDLWDNPTNLTQEEVSWFVGICDDCAKATGINIRIESADHSGTYKGKSKEALGVFCTDNMEDPMTGNSRITIDNYFIHECYEEIFNGKHNLSFDSIEHVIAHEYAHAFQWRHCKRHTKFTEELFQKIKEYQKDKGKE